jgi:hypothetical protein
VAGAYLIDLVERRAQVYQAPLEELGVYAPKPPSSLTPIARELSDLSHYPVIREVHGERRFLLWGWSGAPTTMTAAGRELLVNLSHSLR